MEQQIHPGGSKRLKAAIDDFQLTMQHAIRNDLLEYLDKRIEDDSDILPPFARGEMFDYLMDSDPEFINHCFPYCAVVLTKENMSYLHRSILTQFRRSITSTIAVSSEQEQ